MANKKVCIYTVCTNGYDIPKIPRYSVAGARYFLVTDNPSINIPGYTNIIIPSGDNPIKAQRRAKIWPYDLMPGFDTYLYYDCSYEIKSKLEPLINQFKEGFGVKKHHTRNCIYQEGKRILELKKATPQAVTEQLEHYAELGIPHDYGLQETGILIRDAGEETKKLCAQWWLEVERFTHRDQLGLPAAIFKTGIHPVYLRPHIVTSLFRNHPHKVKVEFPGSKPKIWYSTPYDVDKNIGRALNEFCALVPSPDDYIVLRDGDTMYLRSDWGNHISDIISANGDKYDLISCMTNRLRGKHQLYNGVFSEADSITEHKRIADELYQKSYSDVMPAPGVAGIMMIFKRSVWDKVKFKENSIHFDTHFNKEVIKHGGKIGVATGFYLLHLYRWGSANPFDDVKHLT